jgi:ribonuclease D
MCPAPLPSPILVADDESFRSLVRALAACPVVAVDTESNSLHAYRERVCLLQFSTPDADFIVDPISVPDLAPLKPLFASSTQQKVFHAAEYDIVCLRRDYGFEFANIFDTMSAARALGWPHVGLAAILEMHFGVRMDKRFQRSDWKRRPLTPEQLDYARLDTHYLLALRDIEFQALTEAGHWPEALEEFERLASLRREPDQVRPDPTAFWKVNGARDLTPAAAGILQALFGYREREAERLDRPPFKVMSEATLLELARRAPRSAADLPAIPGMSPDLVQRYGSAILQAIEQGRQAPPPVPPRTDREPDEVRTRYDRLHTWRKERARKRGVESDVILPRTTLWDLARRPPRTPQDLAGIADFGPLRRQAYGAEILALLSRVDSEVNS